VPTRRWTLALELALLCAAAHGRRIPPESRQRRPLDALLPDLAPWARELRHVTPFTDILSAAERAKVYRSFAERERDDASDHTVSLNQAS
jgi:hypothetical protein